MQDNSTPSSDLCINCQKRPIKLPRIQMCRQCYAAAWARQKRANCPEWAAAESQKYVNKHREEIQARARAHYQRNREEMLAKDREYYQRTRDRQRVQRLRYYHEHRDQQQANHRAYYQRTANHQRLAARRYYALHREHYQLMRRRWYSNNLAVMIEHSARRRARKLGAFVAPVNRREIYERDKGICGICGTFTPYKEMHLDHIIPLSRGGTHEPANVQVSHAFCNMSKHAKLPDSLV